MRAIKDRPTDVRRRDMRKMFVGSVIYSKAPPQTWEQQQAQQQERQVEGQARQR